MRAPFDQYVTTDPLLERLGPQRQFRRWWPAGEGGEPARTAAGRHRLRYAAGAGRDRGKGRNRLRTLQERGRCREHVLQAQGADRVLFRRFGARLGGGCAVDLHGIRIGQVTDISLAYDPVLDRVRVPVRYEVQPDRIENSQFSDKASPEEVVADLVRRGMRAKLTNTNLITGAQSVSLEIDPDAPPAQMRVEGDVLVIPSVTGGGLDNITSEVSELLQRVNTIPFAQIGANLNEAAKGLANLTNGQEVRKPWSACRAARRPAGVDPHDATRRATRARAAAGDRRRLAGGGCPGEQVARLGRSGLRQRQPLQARSGPPAGTVVGHRAIGARARRPADAASGGADPRPHEHGGR